MFWKKLRLSVKPSNLQAFPEVLSQHVASKKWSKTIEKKHFRSYPCLAWLRWNGLGCVRWVKNYLSIVLFQLQVNQPLFEAILSHRGRILIVISGIFTIKVSNERFPGLNELDLRYTDLSSIPPDLLAAVVSQMEVFIVIEWLSSLPSWRQSSTLSSITRWLWCSAARSRKSSQLRWWRLWPNQPPPWR